jgi:hypothetical protein
MRQLILLLFILGQIKSVTAQTVIEEVKLPKPKGDLNCFYKSKYSATQRSQFYPFNIADTIKLVSFRYHRHNYPIKGDTLLVDSLTEIKTLTKADVNNLTDILYNNFYKQQPNYGSLTQCFFPRNAILFYDKPGHLKESILLCFHCDRHEESSDRINFGSDCTQKMEKLRQFFVSSGLKFGTDKTIDIYPGESSDE